MACLPLWSRSHSTQPIQTTEMLKKLKKGQQELSQTLGRTLTVNELAASVELSEEEVKELLELLPELQAPVLKTRHGRPVLFRLTQVWRLTSPVEPLGLLSVDGRAAR